MLAAISAPFSQAVSQAVADPATSSGAVEYSDFVRQYLTVAIFSGLALAMVALMLGMGAMLRPSSGRKGDFQSQKQIVYESGVDPVGLGWTQTQVRYYVFALLFVLFDVEAVFIFPWATRLEAYSWFGLVEMAIFIFLLLLGLVYAIRKKVLQWL
ncbi:MAG: NADH-quinone oxidoreductase subunit A [Actinobacteria bacterium]|nr:NADH-quinone oxidoreductase subunit A [Actinomycetota bacterium]